MTAPIFIRTDRHGRHYKTADREILVVSRRYPGETYLWAHVRPLGSKGDFVPVGRDPHGALPLNSTVAPSLGAGGKDSYQSPSR